MASPTSPTLLPDPASLHLVRLETEEQSLLVVVETTSPEAVCPLCHCRGARVHSRYVRLVADLPWAGWAVRLELHVRRFFCPNQECVRQIFDLSLARRRGSLCSANHAFDRALHADRIRIGRGSWQAPGGWHGRKD